MGRSSARWKVECTSFVLQKPEDEFFLSGFAECSGIASDFTALCRTFKAGFNIEGPRAIALDHSDTSVL